MNRVDRLMGYLLLFQSRGLMRAQDFSKQFEVSERTVYRDIQSLCEVGVPIMAMPGEGYRLMEGYYLPLVTFSPQEARSLYLAISMMIGLTTPGATQQAAAAALEKIRAALPTVTLLQVEALQSIIRFYAFPQTQLDFDDDTFLNLQQAIQNQQVIHIRYHTRHSDRITQRDIEPLELAFIEKSWILSAYCRLRQAQRAFRLDRIDAITVLNERFTPRELPEHRFPTTSLTVQVRFDNSVVRWVRERQHFTFVKDGKVSDEGAIMIYNPNTLNQIEWWLLSWGSQLEVLTPASLRERMAKIAAAVAQRHQP